MWLEPQVVLSHERAATDEPGVSFINNFADAIAAAAAVAGDKYVNVLGADIARQCLEAGVLDEVLTCIAPARNGQRGQR